MSTRVLALNPNTSEEVTDAFLATARRLAPADMELTGVTGRFGARIVSSEAENIIAAHSALDLAAAHWPGHDAVILAISFDTALTTLRALLPVPVIGITEAAAHRAAAGGRRIGVVFFGEVSRGLYEALFASYGLAPVAFELVEIASTVDYLSPEVKDAAVTSACKRLQAQSAEAVVICGAAVVGMAERLRDRVPLPVYDGAEAVAACSAALTEGYNRIAVSPRPVGPTIGLSPALADFIAGAR